MASMARCAFIPRGTFKVAHGHTVLWQRELDFWQNRCPRSDKIMSRLLKCCLRV